jgi:hypothetical protein
MRGYPVKAAPSGAGWFDDNSEIVCYNAAVAQDSFRAREPVQRFSRGLSCDEFGWDCRS